MAVCDNRIEQRPAPFLGHLRAADLSIRTERSPVLRRRCPAPKRARPVRPSGQHGDRNFSF